LDKKLVGSLLITLIAMVFTVSLSYYTSTQSNQTNIPSPTPTPTWPPAPTAEPELTHDYVVYEWHLKAEYINNVTWLNNSLATVGKPEYYNLSKTWKENYLDYLSRKETWPAQADGSLVIMYLAVKLFVDAEFDESTGWTKATYQYTEYENVIATYDIEHSLPDMADGRGWTKTFV
jgi:hypothetical protein